MTSEIEAVIEALESHKWIQGQLFERKNNMEVTGCCLRGAMHIALHNPKYFGPDYFGSGYQGADIRIRNALTTNRLVPVGTTDPITYYNDEVANSKEEVIEMLRRINNA